jgi:hypothetical protein
MRHAPAIATRLLERTCPDAEHESVTGDLLEQYQLGRSRFWYWWQVLLIVLPRLYRNPPRRPRVLHVRLPSTRAIAPLSFFLCVLIGATDTRVLKPVVPILLGISFSFLGLEIVRCWHKLHPRVIQALDLTDRKHTRADLFLPAVARPLGLHR